MITSKKEDKVVKALLNEGLAKLSSNGCSDGEEPDFDRVFYVWVGIGMKQLTLCYDWEKDDYYFCTRGHRQELRNAMPKRLTSWGEYNVKSFIYNQRPYFDQVIAATKTLKRKQLFILAEDNFEVLCSQPSFEAKEFSGLINLIVEDADSWNLYFFDKEKRLYVCGAFPIVEQYLISKGYAYEKDEDDLITILEGEQFWF